MKDQPKEPVHVGDGVYLIDKGYCVAVAVNHHENEFAYIDYQDIDKVIDYLKKVTEK